MLDTIRQTLEFFVILVLALFSNVPGKCQWLFVRAGGDDLVFSSCFGNRFLKCINPFALVVSSFGDNIK